MAIDKKKLILNDYYRNFCLVKRTDIFGIEFPAGDGFNMEPYQPNLTIIGIYEDVPDEYKMIFVCMHDRLNKLLSFMHEKTRKNHHYNAEQSRELLSLIDSIFALESNLKEVGVILEIRKEYANWMFGCLGFLKENGGSQIPEGFDAPQVEKFEPIFSIKDMVAEKRLKSTKVKLSSQYQKRQSELMLATIRIDTVKAIGMAKEYVESCLQGILEEEIEEDVEKMNMTALMAKARDYFGLNKSNNLEIRKIVSGLSQAINGLCELRNHKGSGHSHTEKHPRPTEYEAQLAVETAITVVNFYSNIYIQKNKH